MYSAQLFCEERRYSKIEKFPPSSKEYPNFYSCSSFSFELMEGEAIVIPSGWLHYVESKEGSDDSNYNLNIATNYFYKPKQQESTIFELSQMRHKGMKSIEMFQSSNICSESICHAFDTNTPVRISGIFNDHKQLSSSVLCDMFSSNEITVHVSCNTCFVPPNVIPFKNTEMASHLETISFDDFLRKPKNEHGKENYYIMDNSEYRKELKNYQPSFCPQTQNYDTLATNLWVNMGNINTLLHFDPFDNLFIQHRGSKMFILFPPFEHKHLYMLNPYPIDFVLSLKNMLSFSHSKSFPCVQPYKNIYNNSLCRLIIEEFKTKAIDNHFEITPKSRLFISIKERLFEVFNEYKRSLECNDVLPYKVPIVNGISTFNMFMFREKGWQTKWISAKMDIIQNGERISYTSTNFIVFLNDVDDGGVQIMDIHFPCDQGCTIIFPRSSFIPYRIKAPSSQNVYFLSGSFTSSV